MALKRSYTTTQGFACPEAYHRVDNIRTSKVNSGNFSGVVFVLIYKDEASRLSGMGPIMKWSYKFDYDINDTDNIFVQAYNFLKALPEYSGAVDV